MIKDVKFLKYLIQYDKDISKIRQNLSYETSWDGQHFSKPFEECDLPFHYFYYILSDGYVSGSLNNKTEINDDYFTKLMNSKAKNVSAVKRSLKRQAQFLRDNYSLTDLKENIVMHEYYPQQLGIIHTTQTNVFQGKISKKFYAILISLNTNKVIKKDFSIEFKSEHNRYESEFEHKPAISEEQLKKMNKALYL